MSLPPTEGDETPAEPLLLVAALLKYFVPSTSRDHKKGLVFNRAVVFAENH